MVFKDYYKILGLNDITYDSEKIKIAYKNQAKKYHPDLSNNDTSEIFKDISEAYNILSIPEKKRHYDKMWLTIIERSKSKNKTYKEAKREKTIKDEILDLLFGDFFNTLPYKFINNKSVNIVPEKETIQTQIHISIEEAFKGVSKQIILKNLNGKNIKQNVLIPAGILDNEVIKMSDAIKIFDANNDIIFKDLYITIKIDDNKNIKLENNILTVLENLYPWDYVLGKNLKIDLFDEEINFIIPKQTIQNKQFTIKNKGYINKDGTRGDLIIKTNLILPKNFKEQDIEIYKNLKESFQANK